MMAMTNKTCRRERLMWDRNTQKKYIRKQVFKLFAENQIILLLLLDYQIFMDFFRRKGYEGLQTHTSAQ